MPNKRFWKTGLKPSHPKGKRTINKELAEFINNHHEAILNGSSKRLIEGDHLCSTCFQSEQNRFMSYEQMEMDIDNIEESDGSDHCEMNIDNDLDSPVDYAFVRIDQNDAKTKLNQVFEYMKIQMIEDM